PFGITVAMWRYAKKTLSSLTFPDASLRACKARPRPSVLRPGRAKHVEHAGTFGTSTHRVGDVARCAPKVALLYRYFLAVLKAHSRAFQKHSPLLLRVMVQDALCVRRQSHDREHRLLARKDPRRHAGSKFAE